MLTSSPSCLASFPFWILSCLPSITLSHYFILLLLLSDMLSCYQRWSKFWLGANINFLRSLFEHLRALYNDSFLYPPMHHDNLYFFASDSDCIKLLQTSESADRPSHTTFYKFNSMGIHVFFRTQMSLTCTWTKTSQLARHLLYTVLDLGHAVIAL